MAGVHRELTARVSREPSHRHFETSRRREVLSSEYHRRSRNKVSTGFPLFSVILTEQYSFAAPAASMPCGQLSGDYTRLLTLTDHPGLDLIIVLNRVGDRADGFHSPSGLVMETALS